MPVQQQVVDRYCFLRRHTFMASPFNLKSNIDFHVQGGAKVLANPDEKVYTKSAFRQNPGEGTIWIGGENIKTSPSAVVAKLMAMAFLLWAQNWKIPMS